MEQKPFKNITLKQLQIVSRYPVNVMYQIFQADGKYYLKSLTSCVLNYSCYNLILHIYYQIDEL